MNEERDAFFAERIASLERSNRKMKSAVLTIVSAFIAMAALGASDARDVSRARSFELVDSHGHVVARLSQGCDDAEYSARTADCTPGVFVLRPDGGFSRVTLLPPALLGLKPLGHE